MEVECHVSQFEDKPVIPDHVFEYTEALHTESLPIVIDNGKRGLAEYWLANVFASLSSLNFINCLQSATNMFAFLFSDEQVVLP